MQVGICWCFRYFVGSRLVAAPVAAAAATVGASRAVFEILCRKRCSSGVHTTAGVKEYCFSNRSVGGQEVWWGGVGGVLQVDPELPSFVFTGEGAFLIKGQSPCCVDLLLCGWSVVGC